MFTIELLGALLLLAGVVYIAWAAISRGRMSDPATKSPQVDQAAERASTDEIDAHVGSRLRARRMQVGLSQTAVAGHIGVTFSQVQKYEKGSNRIGAGRLYHLTAILSVSVPYFFEG